MSVTAPNGFVATGVHCGIRKKQRRDLAVLRSLEPATGAGMFTINRVQAAPVVLCKEHLAQAQPQAVVVNSGNANAATGANGLAHARATAATAARPPRRSARPTRTRRRRSRTAPASPSAGWPRAPG